MNRFIHPDFPAGRFSGWRRAGLIGCLLLVAAGCRFGASPGNAPAVSVASRTPLLVIAPLPLDATAAEAAGHLGAALAGEMGIASGGLTILADRIPALKPFLSWPALAVNGDLCADELRGVGKAAQCATVLAGILQENRPYAPQRVALTLMWVEVATGSVLNRVQARFDLADPACRKDYAAFVRRGRGAQSRTETAETDSDYAATLMPALFRDYVAARSVARLLQAEKNLPASAKTPALAADNRD